MTATLAALRDAIPDVARDARLNLDGVLDQSALPPARKWAAAIAAGAASRHRPLLDALVAKAREEGVAAGVVDDALAAAALMAMNNVYYRFRHVVAKPWYAQVPARLRMTRLGKPASSKVDLELACLVASAINACEACVRAHEETLVAAGVSEEQVHDAIRIGAAVHAAAVALELA